MKLETISCLVLMIAILIFTGLSMERFVVLTCTSYQSSLKSVLYHME